METIVITTTKEDISLELHLNLWNSMANKCHYLDVGVMCPTREVSYDVNLTIPTNNVEKDVQDLAPCMIKSSELTSLVFNCPVAITQNGDDYKAIATKEDNGNSFIFQIHALTLHTNVFTKDNQLCVRFPVEVGCEDFEYVYYRIRIKNFNLSCFTETSKINSRFLESSFHEITLLDFRINDCKLLNMNQREKVKKIGLSFSKIHFFYIADFVEQVTVTENCSGQRLFENKSWECYIEKLKGPLIAYHLKKSNQQPLSTISFSLKTDFQRTSVKHVFLYVLIVFIIAVFANLFTNSLPCIITRLKEWIGQVF